MRFVIAVVFALLCQPTLAQTTVGTITADDITWYLTTQDSHSKSGWSGGGDTVIVTLFGHATDDTIKQSQGALTIQFYLFEPDGAQFVNEVDIVYFKDESKGAYVTEGHGDGSIIALQHVALIDGSLTVKGDFDVTLLFTDDFGVTLDKDDSTRFTGHFDAVLTHE